MSHFDSIRTEKAPAPVGPYSQATRAGGVVYCSGQISIDPASGQLFTGPVEEQARLVMQNLKAVVEAAGSSMDRVVRCTIFLTDMGDFAKVNEVYGEFFSEPYPARACVEVSALPKGVQVEVDALALAD